MDVITGVIVVHSTDCRVLTGVETSLTPDEFRQWVDYMTEEMDMSKPYLLSMPGRIAIIPKRSISYVEFVKAPGAGQLPALSATVDE